MWEAYFRPGAMCRCGASSRRCLRSPVASIPSHAQQYDAVASGVAATRGSAVHVTTTRRSVTKVWWLRASCRNPLADMIDVGPTGWRLTPQQQYMFPVGGFMALQSRYVPCRRNRQWCVCAHPAVACRVSPCHCWRGVLRMQARTPSQAHRRLRRTLRAVRVFLLVAALAVRGGERGGRVADLPVVPGRHRWRPRQRAVAPFGAEVAVRVQ